VSASFTAKSTDLRIPLFVLFRFFAVNILPEDNAYVSFEAAKHPDLTIHEVWDCWLHATRRYILYPQVHSFALFSNQNPRHLLC